MYEDELWSFTYIADTACDRVQQRRQLWHIQIDRILWGSYGFVKYPEDGLHYDVRVELKGDWVVERFWNKDRLKIVETFHDFHIRCKMMDDWCISGRTLYCNMFLYYRPVIDKLWHV